MSDPPVKSPAATSAHIYRISLGLFMENSILIYNKNLSLSQKTKRKALLPLAFVRHRSAGFGKHLYDPLGM